MTDKANSRHVEREARLTWVPLALMEVSPLAQRDLNKFRVGKLAANLDIEQLGTLTVNRRGGRFYIIDGQHRAEALRQIGYGDQQVQCWTYEGLTETQEAEKFLKLNDILVVGAFARFKVSVQAGREDETAIDQIVRGEGLRVSHDRTDGSIMAVGTLERVYRRDGPENLGRALRIISGAYGDPGLQAIVIDGMGLLCHRYNGQLKDDKAVTQLSSAAGGVGALLGKAEVLRKQTGSPKAHCVAAAAVELINRGGRGRLPSWWKSDGNAPKLAAAEDTPAA